MRKVLITGTAGFIGYHLAELLLAEGWMVHGFDALTDYYDVSLKQARLERLCRLIDKAGGAITLRDAAKSHSYPEGEIRTLCAAFPAVLVTEQRQHLHGGRPSEIVMKAP